MSFGLSDLKSIFDRPKASPQPTGVPQNISADFLDLDSIYHIESQNWYSAKPYGFKMNTREGTSFTMFLPINPSNINVSTNFATNMIPTLYGTVEEHSDIRYYDITIEGTTGMSPRFVEPGAAKDAQTLYNDLRRAGRSSFSVAAGISAGGFFSKTLGIVNKVIGKAQDLVNGDPKPKSGVFAENSGYVAFHNLYRFLLQYKKDASGMLGSTGQRKNHPLTFFNYKDNNEYDVVVRSFTMRKSASDPMLYYYSIQLRGYNLRSISSPIDEDLKQRLKDLGLNGVDSSSILGDIKSVSSNAKSIVGSALGGINVLGR